MITLHHDNSAPITLDLDIRPYLADRLPAHFHDTGRGFLEGACLWHRDGSRPNLAVWTESGAYYCNSCHARGNVVHLVQRVEGFATYGEALDWLTERFGVGAGDDDERAIRLSIGVDLSIPDVSVASWTPPDESILDAYNDVHQYLEQVRGISLETQRAFGIGFDRKKGAITFPWRDRCGTLMTVKKRATWSKAFWYEPKAHPGVKKSLLFGLHRVVELGATRAWVVEAEIDALTLAQRGDFVVAVGGSDFSDEQARELALAGVEEVVLGGDNDAAGRKLNEMVREKMRRYGVKALDCEWPAGIHDANDALTKGRLDELRAIEKRGLTLGRGRCA